jgi:subtilisin-like proprotein convertase family protein
MEIQGVRLLVASLTLAMSTAGALGGTPPAGSNPHTSVQAVRIDVLPGVADKVIDSTLAERITVAILGDAALDAREVDPSTVSLNGAAASKREDGTLASYRDIDGDGRVDLLVDIPSSMMHLGARSSRVFLSGRTLDGRSISGSAPLRTVAAVREERRLALLPDPAAEKRPPVPIAIDILPGDPSNRIELGNRGTVTVAILSTPGFDATTIDPAMVSLAGSPATRRSTGGLASFEDVNADGRPDLVVEVPKRSLRLAYGATSATLRALAADGRIYEGTDRIVLGDKATMTFDSNEAAPAPPPGPSFSQPDGILVVDNSVASPYPSTLTVAGASGVVSKVRVTLKGLTHSFPNDIDVLLVGPTGQSIILMSDIGGPGPGVTSVNLTSDDDAAATLDSVTNPASGTYQPANFGGGDIFPAPAPIPSTASSLSAFAGTNPNGVWSLYVVDDLSGDAGLIAGGWSLDFIMATEICNTGAIAIFDNAAAAPYPSPLNVSGLPVAVSKVALKLKGLSHSFPDDIDMLLVGPGGQKALVMSDAGGGHPGVSNATLVFDDSASLTLDANSNPASGTYLPVDLNPGDLFPGLAPAGPYQSPLYQFDGMNPNGFWYLYIVDDTGADSGSISGGWCLDITTMTPVVHSNPAFIAIPSGEPTITQGVASFYPSTINVSGIDGIMAKTTVTLTGLTHTYPQDLDILLTGPSGGRLMLISDVGGTGPGVSGVNLTFDDDGPPVPISSNPGSGVYAPTNDDSGGTDSMPAPAPSGGLNHTLAEFSLVNPNGPWSLYIYDDAAGDVGYLAGGWSLSIQTFLEPSPSYPPYSYCNFDGLTIPNGAPGTTSGPASHFPAGGFTAGFPPDLSHYKIVVDLFGLTHSFPSDLDILLSENSGRAVMLMSDAGGGAPGVTNVDLTFDDDAANQLPAANNPVSGTYKPTDVNDGFVDTFPAPCCFGAPTTGPYSRDLAAFDGLPSANGWYLWFLDDASGDTGSLTGFCIRFMPSPPPGEVPNLRWADRTTLVWDAAVSASSYELFRGNPSQLPALLDPTADSCQRGITLEQSMPGQTEAPAPGSFYWYVVRGHNAHGDGSPGFDRIVGQELARLQDVTGGACP